jgi:NAD(P)-dependent dehydrogenase (short-subunit alcohol dehydrogenase family)
MTKPLEGRVAVVAGATRGCGRGIAVELGAAGATVYCAGRSVRGRPSPIGRPETIEETAEKVTEAGGRGIWAQADLTEPAQVAALFARVKKEQKGRLDVLVNDVWGGDYVLQWGPLFWKHDLDKGLMILRQAVHSHIITTHHAAPLMHAHGRGLVVEVTDGKGAGTEGYRGSFFYDLVKASVIRIAYAYAQEFGRQRKAKLTALAITPGFLRSEFMLDHFGVTEANWRDAIKKDKHYAESETPRYLGRAVAALAADPDVHRLNGQVTSSWEMAKLYGFTDVDGRVPDWGRKIVELLGPAAK